MTVRLVTTGPDTQPAPRRSARVATVATMLDMDESQVRRMVADGTLESHRIGKRGIRVYLDSVSAWQSAGDAPRGQKPRQPQKSPVTATAQRRALRILQDAGVLP